MPTQEEENLEGQTGRPSQEYLEQVDLRNPSFPVAVRHEEYFNTYINKLMFDNNSRDIMMQPIPFEVGMLQFEIRRDRSGFKKLFPAYHMSLEKNVRTL